MWSLISQGRSLSFTGWSGELFAATRHGGSVSSSERRSASNWRDRIRFTKNVKRHGQSSNNELRTMVNICDDKIIFDKGEIVRNGAALHLDQGIAVTSHASQAKTVDQVIVSVPVRAFRLARRTKHNFTSQCRALVPRWHLAARHPSAARPASRRHAREPAVASR